MGHREVSVTHLRKMMLEELQRRNYSDTTIRRYLHFVEASFSSPNRNRLGSTLRLTPNSVIEAVPM